MQCLSFQIGELVLVKALRDFDIKNVNRRMRKIDDFRVEK